MNGFRTLVFQDLPHVLPPKGLPLTSSHLHTTASTRRFWNFFELTQKEVSRDSKKCPKEIVSSITSNEFDDATRGHVHLSPAVVPVGLSPKMHSCQFDMKTSAIKCLKMHRTPEEDSLISLLDGNPVPKTLKWKLKGYKTLRHEKAGDFAFVPGGKSCDFDVLSKSTYEELFNAHKSKNPGKSCEGEKICSKEETVKIEDKKDTLCSTTRSVENKEVPGLTDAETKTETSSEKKSVPTVSGGVCSTAPKKDVLYLPLFKSEVNNKLKYQSQSSSQYSSRSPARIPKPSQPVLQASKRSTETESSSPAVEAANKNVQEPIANSTAEWSSMEQVEKSTSADTLKERAVKKRAQPSVTQRESRMEEEKTVTKLESVTREKEGQVSSTYFAPRSWKQKNQESLLENGSQNATYESIVGLPPKESTGLNISNRYSGRQVKVSPCAATHARMQQSQSGTDSLKQNTGSFGFDGSSLSGGSSGGSRKPPSSMPPFTPQRMSSSNSSCLQRRLPSTVEKSLHKLNISTSSGNARKCGDRDEPKCPRQRNKCPRRSCEEEEPRKPKCQKEAKKPCKRYCCPALQIPPCCDYSKFQCPKSGKQIKAKERKDPTCLPNESEESGERMICTKPPKKRNDCNQGSCKKERQNCKERSCQRERSCNQEEPPCENRRRSCQRQEESPQKEEGRMICTKPKKKETCKRRNSNDQGCGKRSANCSGRRNFTHSAGEKRSRRIKGAQKFSSLPALGFSLVGMRIEKNKEVEKIVSPENPAGEKTATIFFSSKCGSSETKCQKAKKTESKCKPACSGTKSKEKSKSDNYCSQKSPNSCKDKKAASSSSSGGESAKERAEREQKEIQKCKKEIANKNKKKGEKKATGLERVISPCKQKQMKNKCEKDTKSSSKVSCAHAMAAPFSYLPNATSTAVNNDSKMFGVASNLCDTIVRQNSGDREEREFPSNRWGNFWNFTGDDDLTETDLPVPVIVDNPDNEPSSDSYTPNNWFLSWFNHGLL